MTDLLKVRNSSYILYEETLMEKENLKKEAEQIRIDYLKVFGDLLLSVFHAKIRCIELKKRIAYCQRCINTGEEIHEEELEEYIDDEMAEYNDQLAQFGTDVILANRSKEVSEQDYYKVKEIYYRLAKEIHPDMRPDLAEDSVLKDYWNQIGAAYRLNQLDELIDLEALVSRYLQDMGITDKEIEIEHVDERIERLEKEIERIRTTEPYIYRKVLDDPDTSAKKKQKLEQELNEYNAYFEELEAILKNFEIIRCDEDET